jgi:uncharacterized protein (DUF305 family)
MKNSAAKIALASVVLFAASLAQAADMPKACLSGAPPAPMDMGKMDMSAMGGMSHEMMMSMAKMQAEMGAAMMLKDPDLAFLCGMIPHHQGAINMAQEMLKTGKDAEAKALATAVIAAQTKEIADMTAMIERLSK